MKNSTIRKLLVVAMGIITAGIVMDFSKGNYLTATFDAAVLVLEGYILFNFFKD